ncbi:MAG TPA: branched-chain amino acid ABC transporter permease [Bradyrhizobium sp.]|nr:branched-chain amino acid ABC transporter permease [Bradyrhizobium sp.]
MTLSPTPISWRSPRTIITLMLLVGLALVPLIADFAGQPFYISIATRILIFALAASGLNLALGYGGMVSLGHALFVGLGAYVVGISVSLGLTSGWAHIGIVLLLCGVVAFLTSLVCLRPSGMGFIMITLAFAQMFYFLFVSLKQFGGDEGLPIPVRSDFSPLSIRTNTGLYYFALVVLFVFLYLSWRLVHARFGRVLLGIKSNPRRMRMLGFPVLRYQVVAYVISGCLCGVAGLLLANLTRFTSPDFMFWTVSGDLIVIVMLGGIGTVLGPLVGAVVFLILETVLSSYSQHWMLGLGLIIVLIALLAKRGLYGAIR